MDFPRWRTVYALFTRWWYSGEVTAVHNDLREALLEANGRDLEPSAAIVEACRRSRYSWGTFRAFRPYKPGDAGV